MSDLSTLEALITQNNDLLTHIYTANLFVIGVSAAAFIIFLLYKFIKLFF